VKKTFVFTKTVSGQWYYRGIAISEHGYKTLVQYAKAYHRLRRRYSEGVWQLIEEELNG
jgi:hypothetical protein